MSASFEKLTILPNSFFEDCPISPEKKAYILKQRQTLLTNLAALDHQCQETLVTNIPPSTTVPPVKEKKQRKKRERKTEEVTDKDLNDQPKKKSNQDTSDAVVDHTDPAGDHVVAPTTSDPTTSDPTHKKTGPRADPPSHLRCLGGKHRPSKNSSPEQCKRYNKLPRSTTPKQVLKLFNEDEDSSVFFCKTHTDDHEALEGAREMLEKAAGVF
jgi:hypothetical protein